MPLSEHEQRQLEAIERSLYADDPKFARQVRSHDPARGSHQRLIQGVLLLVLGLVLLVLTVVSVVFGIVGFLVMLAGAVRLTSSFQKKPEPSAGPTRGTRAAPSKSSWTEKAEERWRRRLEGEDR